jgi:hypothetical protein
MLYFGLQQTFDFNSWLYYKGHLLDIFNGLEFPVYLRFVIDSDSTVFSCFTNS